MTQWDFQNKGKSGWTGTSSFVLEVPLRYLRPSVIYSVPCDWILQMAYCFSKFSNQVFAADFYFHNFTKRKVLNLKHYFPYDVKLRILAHSRSFLANQKARNAIFGTENLLSEDIDDFSDIRFVS